MLFVSLESAECSISNPFVVRYDFCLAGQSVVDVLWWLSARNKRKIWQSDCFATLLGDIVLPHANVHTPENIDE